MTLKLFILAVLFVISGGAAFSEYFKGHKFLSLLAMAVAIIATFYLFKDIEEDIVRRSAQVEPSLPVVAPPPNVEPSPPVVAPPLKQSESLPIKKGDFAAYFQPKQDMFETTATFQARRLQLLQQFNAEVKQRNLDYQAGVLRLNRYNADTQIFAVNLKWQADWVKPFSEHLQNSGSVKIGVKEAKQIYQEGSKKPLFITANLKGDQVNVQGVMVEKGWTYSIETKLLPGQVFTDRLQDGSSGPEMVWIPAGSFRMGDIQGGGYSDEKPVHRVNVEQFAMGKYEVTVGEFRQFVNATGYKTEAEKDKGCNTYGDDWGYKKDANWRNPYFSQNNNQPVVCVSWNDATTYVEWLSQQTGKQYRLPTEAEWEYAARAGSETKYWWGNEIGKNRAACDGCGAEWGWDAKKMTAPVGSFNSNPFDLYDTVGNVWEWTCSEYENKYNGKEKKCTSKNRARRPVVRGGSWVVEAGRVRSAFRLRDSHDYRVNFVGFRLARINL